MKSVLVFALVIFFAGGISAQNDIDAIRYSRGGAAGTSRALSMGGAFGAVGADVSSAAFNPAGLAMFRRGEFTFSGGLKFSNNSADIYNTQTKQPNLKFVFNNFGLAIAWASGRDPENRHALAFTSTQVQNFSNVVRMSGNTNNSSIAKDMLNLASEQRDASTLAGDYEWLGFQTYLLDTIDQKFISLLDTKRTVKQVRDLIQTGKNNDVNISYAFTYKDKYYIGASVGIPRIEYESSMYHYEYDEKDSMQLGFTSPTTYTHTYIDSFPAMHDVYLERGGFSELEYLEYFKTTGTGLNFKIGGIARVNDMLRLGFYYHTPTIYRLTDVYYSQMDTYFDLSKTVSDHAQYPDGGGTFEYKLITPSRIGLNSAVVFGKRGLVSLDYEMVNYRKAQLTSSQIDDFANTNALIASKYSVGHNVKIGGELNLEPVMLRAGYAMMGSPFGAAFAGDFVRHTASLGFGIRPKGNFYIDFVWLMRFSNENYYLFNTLDTMARIKYSSNMLGATAGIKF
jgi:hypothetical protein